MLIERIINKIHRIIKRYYTVKEPVFIPVYKGELLKERTILITGGGSGIGFCIAEMCIANGANVILVGRNEQKLEHACNELKSKDKACSVSYEICDVSNKESIEALIDSIIERDGITIDTLINNAGISTTETFGITTFESLSSLMDTNLKGVYYLTQCFSNYLIDRNIKGNVLNVASSSSSRPANNPYGVSKWGMLGFTKGIAKQLIKYGIVVNSVAPGPTAAGMMKKSANGDLTRNSSPAGRYVTAEEIANMVIYLISDMGRMIVGETIFVTGGMGTLTFDDVNY